MSDAMEVLSAQLEPLPQHSNQQREEQQQQGTNPTTSVPIVNILRQHNTYLSIESNRQLRIQQLSVNPINNTPPSLPILSTSFPIETSIKNITTTKINEVKSAFNHAAYCLLRAALLQQQKRKHDSQLTYKDSIHLSQILNITSQSQSSFIMSEIIQLAEEQQAGEDEENRKKQKLLDEKNEKSLKNNASSSSSTTSTTKKTGSGVTYSASSTKASSSMVDSRATVARAILCAAASVAFAELTPDLNCFVDEEKENKLLMDIDDNNTNSPKINPSKRIASTIDPLDVPQNTHYKKQAKKSAEKGAHDIDDDDEGNKKDNEEENDKDKVYDTSTSRDEVLIKKPIVNMGAVMMQAKTLGKRAISYSLAAARRGRERHRFAVESAMQQQFLEQQQRMRLEQYSLPSTFGVMKTSTEEGGKGTRHSPTSSTALLSVTVPNPFGLGGNNNSTNENSSNSIKWENEYSNLFDRAYDPPYPLFNDELVVASKLQSDRNKEKENIMLTDYWKYTCRERMKEIVMTGMGNMVYHDMEWTGRAQRIADFLKHMVLWGDEVEGIKGSGIRNSIIQNFGPHLIVTSESDIEVWEEAFPKLGFYSKKARSDDSDDESDDEDSDEVVLRALIYTGTSKARRRLRRHLRILIPIVNSNTSSRCSSGPPSLVYTKSSQIHVVITSYRILIRDFIHLCQIPWQVVIIDDGMGWLGASQHDPNGKVGRAWDGLWSKADGGIGMAGAFTVNSRNCDVDGFSDFYDDDDSSVSSEMSTDSSSSTSSCSSTSVDRKKKKKKKLTKSKATLSLSSVPSHIGLTSRHRILLASTLTSTYRGSIYPTPVPTLLSFLIPPFSEVTREEWDRSRVYNCAASMKHYRGLLARSVVTYISPIDDDEDVDDVLDDIRYMTQVELAKKAMEGIGIFSPENRKDDGDKSQLVSTDQLISSGKFMQSRRFAVAWLTNNLRQEFSRFSLDPILDAIQRAGKAGYVCEEVVVAPVTCTSIGSNTASGSKDQSSILNLLGSGSGGFKCAIRCGRTFTSEQGLRQHLAALHAPPGTWLCRSCGGDCGTSQARTHHERYCATGGAPGGPNGGAISTVGQIGITAKQHGPGVGKQSGASTAGAQGTGAKNDLEKVDKDGSFRVPGYRGVWVNPAGKNFVKIKNEPYFENDNKKLFDSADEAAKVHDKIANEKGLKDIELNYKEDGKTRIVYEDKSSMASAGRGLEMLGGGASSVVPALSVINIKDLPKNVKPLLRDPKQTSRTGGNSKRYIYAYRGVCRQARKGHDRWQSQISFGGTNHYLGTFDSEWDAAAIYAWAHLILYGEEATRKAQREGEEAAAAWEQEKKDIAAGKIVAPTKPVKKKKAATPKGASAKKSKGAATSTGNDGNADGEQTADSAGKPKTPRKKGTKKDLTLATGGKTTGKSPKDDAAIIKSATERIFVARALRKQSQESMFVDMAVCVPVTTWNTKPPGWAMLIGLSATDFNWGLTDFVSQFPDAEDLLDETSFDKEYGLSGTNFNFRCSLQGSVCTIGRHSTHIDEAAQSLGLGQVLLGGPAGTVDCSVGGPDGSCSTFAARIDYCPTIDADYHFAACNDDDVVTLNGVQIKASMGSFPVRDEDILSVGARVFMFILPKDSSS